MSSATDYLDSAFGNHVLTNTAMTSPAQTYLALFTAGPSKDGTGTEVVGGSYARQPIDWTEGDPGVFTNSSVAFTDMPDTTVVGIGIMDAATDGNMLYFDTFGGVSVAASATYPVDAGTITITHS